MSKSLFTIFIKQPNIPQYYNSRHYKVIYLPPIENTNTILLQQSIISSKYFSVWYFVEDKNKAEDLLSRNQLIKTL